MIFAGGRNPYTGEGLRLSIENGLITAIEAANCPDDQWISSGLIDLQVNGYCGFDLNDGKITPTRVQSLAQKLLKKGTTTFLPTVITASESDMLSAVTAVGSACQSDPLLADMVAGIHLEGPHISPQDGPRGAHPEVHVRSPSIAEFDRLQTASGNLISMMTLSPHWSQSVSFIRALCERNVTVAIGHTDANHEQITAAVDAGATLSTHLGNGAAVLLPRHPNLIWSQLAEQRLQTTFIADGHHLPAETLKVMLRAKGLNNAILVSDVAAPGGLAPGVYSQTIGGEVELSADGRLSLAGTPYLAGAARALSECVAISISLAELSLADALTMATVNPGRWIRRGNQAVARATGRLRVGEAADVITFNWQQGDSTLDIQSVIKSGTVIF